MKRFLTRSIAVIMASLGATLMSYGGVANAAVVSNYGPNSHVGYSSYAKNECAAVNNNNVHVATGTNQAALSGNASVGRNKTWNHNWRYWDPSSWQSRGQGYEDWHTAFAKNMKSHHHWVRDNWGSSWPSGGNTAGGSASSGNATNNSQTATNISINNKSSCPVAPVHVGGGQGGGMVTNTGPYSHTGAVQSSNTTHKTTNNNNVSAHTTTSQHAETGNANVSGNTHAGSASTGNVSNTSHTATTINIQNNTTTPSHSGNHETVVANHPVAVPAIEHAIAPTVSNTAPNSAVKYNSHNTTNTAVVNTSNITTAAITNQNAQSGDANVSGNTTAGSASTGSVYNSSTTTTNVVISN